MYSSYLSCAFEWRVPEDAALLNIDNILSVEAITYHNRKLKADAGYLKCFEDVNRFILSTFHGLESQEATFEYLDYLSMYELAKDKGSLV